MPWMIKKEPKLESNEKSKDKNEESADLQHSMIYQHHDEEHDYKIKEEDKPKILKKFEAFILKRKAYL